MQMDENWIIGKQYILVNHNIKSDGRYNRTWRFNEGNFDPRKLLGTIWIAIKSYNYQLEKTNMLYNEEHNLSGNFCDETDLNFFKLKPINYNQYWAKLNT